MLPKPLRSKLIVKIAVPLVAIAIVVSGFGAVIYTDVSNQIRSDTQRNLQTDADVQSAQIDRWFRTTREDTQAATRGIEIRIEGESVLKSRFGSLVEDDYVRSAYLVNLSTGRATISRGEKTMLRNDAVPSEKLGLMEQLHDRSDGGVVTSRPTDVGGNPSILFLDPVGESDRAVVIVADLRELSKDFLYEPADGSVSVVNGEGTVVMAGDPSRIGNESVLAGANVQKDSGFTTVDSSDGRLAVGHSKLENHGWRVAVKEPTATAYALESRVSTSILAMLFAVVAGFVVVGLTVRRTTVSPIQGLSAKATKVEEGDLSTEMETDRADEIGDLYRSIDGMRTSLNDRIEEARRAREESEELSRHLVSKADEYGEVMDDCADGDLRGRLEPSEKNEAMARIATSFNDMMDEIAGTIRETRDFSSEVSETSTEVNASANEIRDTSEQVSKSIQAISEGATTQDRKLEAVLEEMESLSATIEETAATTDQVAEVADEMARRGKEGSRAAQAALDGLERIEAGTEETIGAIDGLESDFERISEFAAVIEDIASETNQLALNANIEASRAANDAADAQGFGVVADQIKELAEDTKAEVDNINETVEVVGERTDRTIAEIEDAVDEVTEQSEDIEAAITALEQITELVRETNEGIQEINELAEQQAASTQEVVAMVESVNDISRETAEQSEEVAAAAEEQAATVASVSEIIESLTDQAQSLQRRLEDFRVPEKKAAAD